MLRVVYWALIVSGLYNAAWIMVSLTRGDGGFAILSGTLSAACLLTAAALGDDLDGA